MKITELRNQNIEAEKTTAADGQEIYRLMFTDKNTDDIFWLAFDKATRDVIVRQLTGGIVLAGGELSKANGDAR